MKSFKRLLKLSFSLGLVLAIGLIGASLLRPRIIEIHLNRISSPPYSEKPVKLVFVGDIMLDRGVKYMVEKQGKNDYSFPFLKVADKLKDADIVVGNLESQISDQGAKIGSIYSFRAHPQAIEGLKFAGFDIISLANNHAFDYGSQALQDSLNRLIEASLLPVGAGNENQAFSPTLKTINRTKIAFFAYNNQGLPSWQAKGEKLGIAQISQGNLERIKADIRLAKDLADIVLVYVHWGEEYNLEPNDNQIDLARAMIDQGADMVIGSHPHVIQKSEIYNGHYIFYSLGNFIFDQGFSDETLEGLVVEVSVQNKQIKEVASKQVKINSFFQPEI